MKITLIFCFNCLVLFGVQGFVFQLSPIKLKASSAVPVGKKTLVSHALPTNRISTQLSANDVAAYDVPKISMMSRLVSTLPNAMTVGRVLTIPFIMNAMATEKITLALFLFILSSLTDFLDGYLARKLNIQSSFGSFLDPVADKLLMASTLVLLTVKFPSMVFAVPTAIILCREIAVSALREWMAERNVRNDVKVSQVGKWKTAFQMIATALLLWVDVDGTDAYQLVGKGLIVNSQFVLLSGFLFLYLSTALTVYSGVKYFLAAWPLLLQ